MGIKTARKVIFLVDDDVTNLTTAKKIIVEHYDIFTFNSGKLLLNALERKIPDLILLDIEMPEMNGYETLKIIKGNEKVKDIPVIFLTSNDRSESELEGLSLGAADYVTKPFSPPLLLKRIEMHLLIENQKNDLIAYNNTLEERVSERTKTVVELQNGLLRTMSELVECKDGITGWHIERTQSYLKILLDALVRHGLHKEEVDSWSLNLEFVLQSAQLHDIGKIAIKDETLNKPGRFTDEEREEMNKHPIYGERIIEKIKQSVTDPTFLEYARIFAVTHHEKWDGTGYPKALKGEEIPLLGRLMAIADVYDALTSKRPYKEPFSHERAGSIIVNDSGTHFDPALVDLFLTVGDEFSEMAANHNANEFSFSGLRRSLFDAV